MFSDAQDLSAISTSGASTNLIDFGSARDMGVGEQLYVVLIVDTALTDASSNSTVTVDLYADSTTSFTPDASRTLFTIAATAAAGTKYIAPIPPDVADYQYLELYFTMNNGDLTTGAVTAFITKDIDKFDAYPDNVTIS